MPVDLIEEIRQKLGSDASLPKIDPNTQQPRVYEPTKIESAAIPAVLTGIFKRTRNEEDANSILSNSGEGILDIIFGEQKDNVIKSVAQYASTNEADAKTQMEKVAASTKKIVGEHVKDLNAKSLVSFFTDQRTNILKHLPPELNIGELLNDSSMDDKTNKMEGPMSGLMHGIEKLFSSTK